MKPKVLQGDCLAVLKTLDDNSVDSLVTDPPAGISFMGKAWDSDKGGSKEWIKWMESVMRECLRVMKPGAHGLVWAIPRTSHWTATACEDAGFEIRDVITHLFGSGFPKSLDVSKAIDKAAGAEREATGPHPNARKTLGNVNICKKNGDGMLRNIPSTDAAKQWQGFGTALKPASEHWILVRKPLGEKTVAKNVLKWGTGALNIDGSRVAGAIESGWSKSGSKAGPNLSMSGANTERPPKPDSTTGRFPSNLVLSHSPECEEHRCTLDCAVKELDRQSGTLGNAWRPKRDREKLVTPGIFGGNKLGATYPDQGGASRFFYVAKISTRERNAGCEAGTTKKMSEARLGSPDPSGKFPDHDTREKTGNFHPTVKPKKLMAYLIRMVTPPKGLVLDPFAGSGSTGVACAEEGFQFLGIEREPEYVEIAKKRIYHALPAFKKQVSL